MLSHETKKWNKILMAAWSLLLIVNTSSALSKTAGSATEKEVLIKIVDNMR